MQSRKDYYGILQVPASASQRDIKRSFRRLAMLHHPDKQNGGSFESNAAYSDVQEAYKVLTTPHLREAYLQTRWLLRASGRGLGTTQPHTPQALLETCRQLKEQVAMMDIYRMSHRLLADQVLQLLAPEQLAMLQQANNGEVNRSIAEELLNICLNIEYPALLLVLQPLQTLVRMGHLESQFNVLLKQRRQAHWWQQNQYWIIALATLCICLVMLFS